MSRTPTKRELSIRLAAFERLVDERFKTQAEALRLQAAEYERRMEHLNGETGRMSEMQGRLVPRELYDADRRATRFLVIAAGTLVVAVVALLLKLG